MDNVAAVCECLGVFSLVLDAGALHGTVLADSKLDRGSLNYMARSIAMSWSSASTPDQSHGRHSRRAVALRSLDVVPLGERASAAGCVRAHDAFVESFGARMRKPATVS